MASMRCPPGTSQKVPSLPSTALVGPYPARSWDAETMRGRMSVSRRRQSAGWAVRRQIRRSSARLIELKVSPACWRLRVFFEDAAKTPYSQANFSFLIPLLHQRTLRGCSRSPRQHDLRAGTLLAEAPLTRSSVAPIGAMAASGKTLAQQLQELHASKAEPVSQPSRTATASTCTSTAPRPRRSP